MQMYPGAVYNEHHYKVEKGDNTFRDDFHFNKNSGMNRFGHSNTDNTFRDDFHLNKNSEMNRFGHSNPGTKHGYMSPDHHLHNRLSPNMHMMGKPDHCNPIGNRHGYEGGYYGPNKHGNNYSETIYEQEETEYHVNRFDNHYNNHNGHKHFNGGDQSYYMSGAPGHGGYKEHERYYSDGRVKGAAMWDSKGIDD